MIFHRASVILALVLPLAVAGCDGDESIAVNMIGVPLTVPGTSHSSCQVTVTVTNGLDKGVKVLQVSYGYMPDENNINYLLVGLPFRDVAAKGKVKVQEVIAQKGCARMITLRQPIISSCLTEGGEDCRKDTVLSQDGTPVVYN